jgi:hypothetical protein
MKNLNSKISVLILSIIFTMLSSCAMFSSSSNATEYKDGYYIATLHHSYDKVYNATIESIKVGQICDLNGKLYNISSTDKMNTMAVIVAKSQNSSSDYLDIIIKKVSKDTTKIYIKDGASGASIRSSSLVTAIQQDIDRPQLVKG